MFFDFKQLNVEDERGVRSDGTGSLAAVSEVAGNKEPPSGTFLHELKSLGPSCDYLSDAESGRLSALDGTVENGTVDESSGVMNCYGIVLTRLGTGAFFNDKILKAACGDFYTLLLSVFLKETFSGGDVFLVEFPVEFGEIVGNDFSSLFVGHFSFSGCHCGVQSLSEIVGVNLLDT